MGRKMSPRYSQSMMASGCSTLTAVNSVRLVVGANCHIVYLSGSEPTLLVL